MLNMNIIGNLGAEPKLRITKNGRSVTNLNVAVNDSYTDANGVRVQKVTWFRVAVWGKSAEAAATYLKKGSQVAVIVSEIKASAYINKNGEAAASLEATARSVQFLDRANRAADDSNEVEFPDSDLENIPF